MKNVGIPYADIKPGEGETIEFRGGLTNDYYFVGETAELIGNGGGALTREILTVRAILEPSLLFLLSVPCTFFKLRGGQIKSLIIFVCEVAVLTVNGYRRNLRKYQMCQDKLINGKIFRFTRSFLRRAYYNNYIARPESRLESQPELYSLTMY